MMGKKILLMLAIGVLLAGCTKGKRVELAVPKPTGEDIVRTFFNLINEKRIPEAIGMMSQGAVPNESVGQAWGVQFNDFESVKVINVEKTSEENLYQVTLEVKVNERAANNPIPYYGYGGKSEVRFVKLVLNSQGLMKIEGIATGP